VIVMPVGWPIAEPFRGNAVLRIADTIDWLCWRIADFELASAAAHCDIELLPTPSTRMMTPFDMRATARLIDEAYEMTSAWLDRPAAERMWTPGGVRAPVAVPAGGLAERGRRLVGRLRRSPGRGI
jgi:hypothetical protein